MTAIASMCGRADLVYSVPGAIADSLPSWAASTNLLAFSMPSNPKQLVNNQEHPQRTVVSMDDDYSPLSNERSVDTASMDLVFTPSGPLALPVTNDTRTLLLISTRSLEHVTQTLINLFVVLGTLSLSLSLSLSLHLQEAMNWVARMT